MFGEKRSIFVGSRLEDTLIWYASFLSCNSVLFFRTIIEFLYGFLVPGYMLPNPRTKPLHDEMIEILKKINYHGTVSKSHFQTLGGPSWGTIVGVLHFFLLLAKSVVALSMPENFRKMNFPNNDEGNFE